MMKKFLINPYYFYKFKYEGDTDVIGKHINHIKEFDPGRKVSNAGGYQSNNITFGFEDLLKTIQGHLIEIYGNRPLAMNGFWLNENTGNDYNTPHIHIIQHPAVVYYYKVCCEKSPIVFSSFTPYIDKRSTQFVPEDNDIIIFDGSIPHEVLPCKNTDHRRISIAFNFEF